MLQPTDAASENERRMKFSYAVAEMISMDPHTKQLLLQVCTAGSNKNSGQCICPSADFRPEFPQRSFLGGRLATKKKKIKARQEQKCGRVSAGIREELLATFSMAETYVHF